MTSLFEVIQPFEVALVTLSYFVVVKSTGERVCQLRGSL